MKYACSVSAQCSAMMFTLIAIIVDWGTHSLAAQQLWGIWKLVAEGTVHPYLENWIMKDEKEGYLLPTWAWKINWRCFDRILQSNNLLTLNAGKSGAFSWNVCRLFSELNFSSFMQDTTEKHLFCNVKFLCASLQSLPLLVRISNLSWDHSPPPPSLWGRGEECQVVSSY